MPVELVVVLTVLPKVQVEMTCQFNMRELSKKKKKKKLLK